MRQNRFARLFYKKGAFLFSAVLVMMGLVLCFSYINLTNQPAESFDISPVKGGWTYALADGTPVAPDESGVFALPEGELLYCSFTFTDSEWIPEKIYNKLSKLQASGGVCDAVFFLNGDLIASPTGRFVPGEGFPAAEAGLPVFSAQFTFRAEVGDTLTMAVQFLSGNMALTALPAMTFYGEVHAYGTVYIAPAVRAALPAGMFLAVALFLLALFLYQMWNGQKNWQLLLLALTAFAFCLNSTVSYALSVLSLLQKPIIIWLANFWATLPLLWLLWYYTTGKRRKYFILLPAACTVAVIVALCIGLRFDGRITSPYPTLLSTKILPAAMVVSLILGLWEWKRGSVWHKRFCLLCGCIGGAELVIALISSAFGGAWWEALVSAFHMIRQFGTYLSLLELVNQVLLLAFFLIAVYDLIADAVARDTQISSLTMQNRYAAENAAILRQSLDHVRAVRHEQQHHMEALRTLCNEGDLARISAYVEDMAKTQSMDQPMQYTHNALVNALITPRLRQVIDAGVKTHVSIQIPEKLSIRDADLSVFLTNLLDNAVEAVCSVTEDGHGFLTFKMGIHQKRLFISCENTCQGKLRYHRDGTIATTKQGEGHGIGMRIMHSVAQAYNSILVVECEDNIFRVKTSLELPD